MKKYSVKEELKQVFLTSAKEHPHIIMILLFLFAIPVVFGFLCILTIPMQRHGQELAQVEQKEATEMDTWGSSVIESMPDMDSVKTQETIDYYMDVRTLDDGNKEVRIQRKNSAFSKNTLYYIIYKDFSYIKVEDNYEISKRFPNFKHD